MKKGKWDYKEKKNENKLKKLFIIKKFKKKHILKYYGIIKLDSRIISIVTKSTRGLLKNTN